MAALAIAVRFGDHSYDGPFDALFNLIRYHDYPIDALPIARLTADFLAYIRNAKDLDEELGGEFIEVASWLVLLKSRAILPVDAFTGTRNGPQEELQRVLVDRGLVGAVTEDLKQRVGTKPQFPLSVPVGRPPDAECDPVPQNVNVTVGDLLSDADKAMAIARARRYGQEVDGLSVEEAGAWVIRKLASMPIGTAESADPWFEELESPSSCAALLLALLELARLGYVLLYQQHTGGRILVKQIRTATSDAVLSP